VFWNDVHEDMISSKKIGMYNRMSQE